jgi:hypothetical protein
MPKATSGGASNAAERPVDEPRPEPIVEDAPVVVPETDEDATPESDPTEETEPVVEPEEQAK